MNGKLKILVEDSTSGFAFWKMVNRLLLNDEVDVRTVNGNMNFKSYIQNMIISGQLGKNNSVIVAIDNIIGNGTFIYAVEEIRKLLDSVNCEYVITKYRSIEEVFLSFKDLQNIVPFKTKSDREAYILIYNCIWNVLRRNYFILLEIKNFLYRRNIVCKTREEASKKILNYFTYYTPFYFKNKEISYCWFGDCKEFKYFDNYCKGNNCYYYRNALFRKSRERMKYFWLNTILNKDVCSLRTLMSKVVS